MNDMLNVDRPFHFGLTHQDGDEENWHSIDLDKVTTDRTIYDEFNVARFLIKPCTPTGHSTMGDCPAHKIDGESIRKSIQSITVLDSAKPKEKVQSENEYLNSTYNWQNLKKLPE
jgi:hypothetical protein